MEFGMCIPPYGKVLNVRKIIENVQYAEQLGFDSVWVTDHIIVPKTMDLIYRDNMLEPVTLLSHLAGLVPRVKLGTSVLIESINDPGEQLILQLSSTRYFVVLQAWTLFPPPTSWCSRH